MKLVSYLFLITVLLMPSSVAAGKTPAAVFGNILVRCGICHTDRIITIAQPGQVSFADIASSESGQEKMCYSCHNGIVRDSRGRLWERFQHPDEGRPRNPTLIQKSGFSLDSRGRLFCGTCHTPHVKGEGIGLFMRFAERDGAFCRKCHPKQGTGPRQGEHASLKIKGQVSRSLLAAGGELGKNNTMTCYTCHRVHGASSPFLLVVNPWGNDGLCQGCHGLNPSNDTVGFGKATHPVNVKTVSPPEREWVRDQIVLSPGGRVDCWSCHRVHNGERSFLLVSELSSGNGCRLCHAGKSSSARGAGNHPVYIQRKDDKKYSSHLPTCLSCHRAHNSFDDEPFLLNYVQAESSRCKSCHQKRFDTETNHPVGVPVQKHLAGKLKSFGASFGRDSSLQCSSCHRIHNSLSDTSLLAVEEKMLCLYCHERQNYLSAQNAPPGTHPILVGTAEDFPEELRLAGGRLGPQGELICTSCHRVHDFARQSSGLIMDEKSFSCTICHREYSDFSSARHALTDMAALPSNKNLEKPDPCRTCHSEHGWKLSIPEGSQDLVTRICLSCHNRDGLAREKLPYDVSHPLGVMLQPKKALSIDLPLFLKNGRRFKKGEVSCASCHEIHKDNDNNGHLVRLQTDGESSLCLECHENKETIVGTKHDLTAFSPDELNISGTGAKEGGLCSPCHLAHGGIERTMWARLIDGQGSITAQFCRSCHLDGLVAGKKVPGPSPHSARSDPGGPDTASMSYEEISNSAGVVCSSCHDPHLWNPEKPDNRGGTGIEGTVSNSFLRWPDDNNSSLCVRCHPREGSIEGTDHDLRGRQDPGTPASKTGEWAPSLCGACHATHQGAGALGWPSQLQGSHDPMADICLACHANDRMAQEKQTGSISHPIGVTPGSPGTGILPLFDEQGRKSLSGFTSCPTCHNVHESNYQAGSADAPSVKDPDGSSSFLRLTSSEHSPLCAECHPGQALISGTNHDLRVTAPRSKNSASKEPRESGLCLVCHGIHQLSYEFFLWNRPIGPGNDIITGLCTGCHAEGQIAKSPEQFYVHFQNDWSRTVSSPRTTFTLKGSSRQEKKPFMPLHSGDGKESTYGFITCLTCHDPHRWDSSKELPGTGVPQEGRGNNSFLKLKGSFTIMNTFCAGCHPDDPVQKYEKFHFPGLRE